MPSYAVNEFRNCSVNLGFIYDPDHNILEMNGSCVSTFVESISVERPTQPQRRIPISGEFQNSQVEQRSFMFGICRENNFIISFEGVISVADRIDIVELINSAQNHFTNNPSNEFIRYNGNDFGATRGKIRYVSCIKYKDDAGFKLDALKYYLEIFDSRLLSLQDTKKSDFSKTEELKFPHQLIYYGAPGTGKSYATNDAIENHSAIRTTFHPDSDYATFVGSYKPVSSKEYVYGLDSTGHSHQVNDSNGNAWEKDEISYKFIKQAFLKAYVNAWKLWADTCKDDKELEPQFLVIEEINRGNCAQIFGDLFQLLDRKNGFSEYPIEADKDICTSLLEDDTDENPSFGKTGLVFTDAQITIINKIYDIDGKPSKEVADKIAKGKVLVLPPNFYIWATMNTSDQSLLPMDSAFKRRWKWKYIPIEQAEIGLKDNPRKWKIEADGHYCYWWEFLQAINDEIEDVSHTEDKQLGYYFCKPENGEYITAKDFVSKVIFYLWNDIFKDEDSSIFHYKELEGHWNVDGYQPKKENLYFRNFITGKDSIDEKLVRWFINNLLQKKEISLLDDIDQNPIGEDIAYMRKVKNDSIENSSENIDDTRTEIHDDEEDANASV